MAYLVLVVWVMSLGAQTPASLRIEVLEGQGAVFQPGSPSYKGITVRITDATGQPVPAIPVHFTLPSAEPTGQFPNGSNSEMQVSDAQGKASIWGIRWGSGTGTARVAISAGSGPVTAGMVLAVQVGNGNSSTPTPPPPAPVVPTSAPPPPPTKSVEPAVIAGVTVSPAPAPKAFSPATPAGPVPAPVPERAVAAVAPAKSISTVSPPSIRADASFEVPAASVFPAPAAPLVASPTPVPAPEASASLVESRGVIFTRNVGPAERFPSSGGRRKWVAVSLGIAGAVGGGMAYRMLNKPGATPTTAAPTPTIPTPALSLSAPIITVAKP